MKLLAKMRLEDEYNSLGAAGGLSTKNDGKILTNFF